MQLVRAANRTEAGPVYVDVAVDNETPNTFKFALATDKPTAPAVDSTGSLPPPSLDDALLLSALASSGAVVPPWHPQRPGGRKTLLDSPGVPNPIVTEVSEGRVFWQHAKGYTKPPVAFVLALPFNPLRCKTFVDQRQAIEQLCGPLPSAEQLDEWMRTLRAQAPNLSLEAGARSRALKRTFEASGKPPVKKGRAPAKAKKNKGPSKHTSSSQAQAAQVDVDDSKLVAPDGFLLASITNLFPAAFVGEYVRQDTTSTKNDVVMPPWWGPPRSSYYQIPFPSNSNTLSTHADPHSENLFIAREWVRYCRRRRLNHRSAAEGALDDEPYVDQDYDPHTWISFASDTQWLTDEDEDEDDNEHPVSYGVSNRAVPPWVSQQLAQFVHPIIDFALNTVRSTAEHMRLSPLTMSHLARQSEAHVDYKTKVAKHTAYQLFGSAAAVPLEGDNNFLYAAGFPPSQHVAADTTPSGADMDQDRPQQAGPSQTVAMNPPGSDLAGQAATPHGKKYRAAIEDAMSQLIAIAVQRDQRTLLRLKQLDDEVESMYSNRRNHKTGDYLGLDWVKDNHEPLLRLTTGYGVAPYPDLLVKVVKLFLEEAEQWGYTAIQSMPRLPPLPNPTGLVPDGDDDLPPLNRLATAKTNPNLLPNPDDRENEDPDQLRTTRQAADQLLGSSYGVDDYMKWDMWTLAVHLGLDTLQPPWNQQYAAEVAEQMQCDPDFDPHAITQGPDGCPLLDEDGEPVWLHPQAHSVRSTIIWPYFNAFDPHQPLNPQAWQEAIDKAGTTPPSPSPATHRCLSPKWHQVVAIANILDRGYVCNPWSPNYWTTVLADETGLGKTWIPLMLLTILRYHRVQSQHDPQYAPPVMSYDKPRYRAHSDDGPSQ